MSHLERDDCAQRFDCVPSRQASAAENMPVHDWGRIALLMMTLVAAEISMAQPARMMRRCDVHGVRQAVGGVRDIARSRE